MPACCTPVRPIPVQCRRRRRRSDPAPRAAGYGEGDRGWVLSGLRGVGKTVLLNPTHARAEEALWITVKVEATSKASLAASLNSAMVKSLRTATGRHPVSKLRRLLGVFTSFNLTFNPTTTAVSLGTDVNLVTGSADSGRFADDLAELFTILGETSRELGIGTLILVDELQEGRRGRPRCDQRRRASDRAGR